MEAGKPFYYRQETACKPVFHECEAAVYGGTPAGVTVLLGQALESVKMEGKRILSASMVTGETIKASMFINATYEGDLMAAAKVSYRVGREPGSAFNESLVRPMAAGFLERGLSVLGASHQS